MASLICKLVGTVFVIVAVWGFVNHDKVLVFEVNMMHNMVHLLSGIIALACGFAGPQPARMFCLIFGVVYGLVAALGLLNVQYVVELLHLNKPDNYLHVGLALVFLLAGLAPASTAAPASQQR